jgi:hypothetical protein
MDHPASRRPDPRGYDRPKFNEVYSGTPLDEPKGQDPRFRHGAGGLLSTASDLLLWQKALASGRILSPAWLKEMQTPHGLITPDGKFKYGYAWVIQSSKSGPMLWHNGVWHSYYTEVRVSRRPASSASASPIGSRTKLSTPPSARPSRRCWRALRLQPAPIVGASPNRQRRCLPMQDDLPLHDCMDAASSISSTCARKRPNFQDGDPYGRAALSFNPQKSASFAWHHLGCYTTVLYIPLYLTVMRNQFSKGHLLAD